MKQIIVGIIFTLFSFTFFMIWKIYHKERESDPTVRMSMNRTLILSLIGMAIGIGIIIVGILGK